MNALPFAKAEAAGNDLILLDGRDRPLEDPSALSRRLCDRRFGVGGDGIMTVEPGPEGLPFVRMFNPDGSEDFCGNGMRCVAAWLAGDAGEMSFVSPRGRHKARVLSREGRRYEVDVELTEPVFEPRLVPVRVSGPRAVDVPLQAADWEGMATCLAVGSTHTVIFLDAPLDDETFFRISPLLERHALFPERTSVLWCRVESPLRIAMRIWERAVGETFSCGTGACAAVVAGLVHGLTESGASVVSRGGTLRVLWNGRGSVRLIGPARIVYSGQIAVGN